MNTKHGSFWYVAAKALAVLSFAAGLIVPTGAAAKADSSSTVLSSHQSLAAGQAVNLVISGDLGGDVHIIGSGGNDVSVTAKPKGTLADRVELTTSRDSRALRINLDLRSGSSSWRTWMHWHNTNVEVVMRVPRKAAVAVTNINGPVLVDNATGRLTVRVVNGPIEVNGAGSVLSLQCTNGPIDVNIADLSAVPDIDMNTTNGAIDVRVPKAFKAVVTARTVFGSVDTDVPSGPGRMSLHVVAGAISVGRS
ncbi:MAG TPA: hypothetical protein VKR99_02785 [Candidatus Eremiobacteraceae bacterium]|nr:hypothetical protein [Candidatus Eremiobacteraceae bacterium]